MHATAPHHTDPVRALLPQDERWVTDRGSIALHYLRGWFWIDAPSSLPIELIDLALAGDNTALGTWPRVPLPTSTPRLRLNSRPLSPAPPRCLPVLLPRRRLCIRGCWPRGCLALRPSRVR
jgi:hypothetical protein